VALLLTDLGGQNLSVKPEPGFDIDTLNSDILELIKFLGKSQTKILGHDWGAAIAWAIAARFPSYTSRYVILNSPPIPKLVDAFHPCHFQQLVLLFLFMPRMPKFMGAGA
jgi:pimeloyl-ACP methyl ester carboxylesterase